MYVQLFMCCKLLCCSVPRFPRDVVRRNGIFIGHLWLTKRKLFWIRRVMVWTPAVAIWGGVAFIQSQQIRCSPGSVGS